MNQPLVFISCVSSEFRQTRSRVGTILTRMGFTPVIQEIFGTEPGDLRQVLRDKIDTCEGLIQIVGYSYGAEPPTVDAAYGRVSYTQFEFLYAREKNKKTWLIFPGDACTRDTALERLDLANDPADRDPTGYQAERRALQLAYCNTRRNDGHIYYDVVSDADIELKVERLRDELVELRRAEEAFRREVLAGQKEVLGRLTRAPATQVAFNVLGFFTFSLSLYLAIYYQTVMNNSVGPLLLLIGMIALPLCLWLILALAFRHARTTNNTTLSDRLVPFFGFKASDGWHRLRWAGWFLYIAFPVTITIHFWLEARKLILHQDNAPDVSLVERNMPFPDYFYQGRWDVIFGTAPHYWWGTGPNHVQAFPIIQPWLNSILAASVLILAFTYTFCVLTGVGATKIRKNI